MAGPNFNKNSGIGKLATNRYDFENHVEGNNRHHADNDITISNPINGITASNVHEVLVALNNNILNFDFFVTVGEGSDVYASGAFNGAVPNLDVELNDVLYNVNNPKNARILNGGIIVIKSGTYKIGSTVDLPAGITIMGEGFGTKLVNTTPANGGSAPMFRIKGDIDRFEDKAVVSSDPTYDPFTNSKSTKFQNCIIADNYVKPAFLGDTAYRSAQNVTFPLIYIENGAALICENVTFSGRSGSGDPTVTTLSAIDTDPFSGSTYPTALVVVNCEFDGFNRLVKLVPTHGTLDNFKFIGNSARFFGPVGGVATNASSNAFFLNGLNATIADNYITADTNPNGYIYIDAFTADTATLQNKSKMSITNNVFASDKASNSPVTATLITYNAGIVGSASTYLIPFISGNLFDGVTNGVYTQIGTVSPQLTIKNTTVSVGDVAVTTGIAINAIDSLTIDSGKVEKRSKILNSITAPGGNYTVDSDPSLDYILLFPNDDNFVTIGQVAVTMPPCTPGRILIFKNLQNSGSANTATRAGSDRIEDPFGTGYINTVNISGIGLIITYMGVADPGGGNVWVILSAWSATLGAVL